MPNLASCSMPMRRTPSSGVPSVAPRRNSSGPPFVSIVVSHGRRRTSISRLDASRTMTSESWTSMVIGSSLIVVVLDRDRGDLLGPTWPALLLRVFDLDFGDVLGLGYRFG